MFLFYCLFSAAREHNGKLKCSPLWTYIGLPGIKRLLWWVWDPHLPLCGGQWPHVQLHLKSGWPKVKYRQKSKFQHMVMRSQREGRKLRITLLLDLGTHSLSHLFIQKCLLSTYGGLGTVLTSRDTMLHKRRRAYYPHRARSLMRGGLHQNDRNK